MRRCGCSPGARSQPSAACAYSVHRTATSVHGIASARAVMKVTVKYGKDSHDLELEESCTLGTLCTRLENVAGVPTHLQKIVFKGKSVHAPAPGEDDPVLSDVLKLRDGCKLMLLGRKLDPAREALMEVLVKEDEATAAVNRKLDGVEEQLDRTWWKPFLPCAHSV